MEIDSATLLKKMFNNINRYANDNRLNQNQYNELIADFYKEVIIGKKFNPVKVRILGNKSDECTLLITFSSYKDASNFIKERLIESCQSIPIIEENGYYFIEA